MRVILARHGDSEEAGYKDGRIISDEERQLTEKGREDVARTARTLSRLVRRIDGIASSPLLRAVQTAEIIAASYGLGETDQLGALQPHGAGPAVLSWLEHQSVSSSICLVGHEPALGLLAGWLMCAEEKPLIHFCKAGICCLEFSDFPSPGTAVLRWMLTPEM